MRRAHAAARAGRSNTSLMVRAAGARRTASSATLPRQHEVDDRGVVLGQAAPVALRDGVEGHQVRQPQLHGFGREADDTEGSLPWPSRPKAVAWPAGRARGLEDLLRQVGTPRLPRRTPESPSCSALNSSLVELSVERGAVLATSLEPRVVDVDGDDVRAERGRDLHAEAADAADADEDREVAGARARCAAIAW